jgi:Ni,Fe-hydrogenase I cytochrome b subunit
LSGVRGGQEAQGRNFKVRDHSRLPIADSRVVFLKFVMALKTSELIMGIWRQLQEYFYLKKRDPNAPHTQWMRYMHGINRISLFMFLLAIIIIIVKLILMKR